MIPDSADGAGTNATMGALKIYAAQSAVGGFLVQDTLIKDATYSGIQLHGPFRIDNLRFERVEITGAGTFGIQASSDANGTAVANTVTVTNGGLNDLSRGAFGWVREAGNVGW